MKARRSFSGPIVLILIGVLFLIHSIAPNFRIGEIVSQYWPYLLIGWGVLELLEVCVRFAMKRSLPVNGISGGGWFLVFLISIAGLTAFEVRRTDVWWQRIGFERGIQAFGGEHEFSISTVERTVGKSPRLVIESFRGDAKISGVSGMALTVAGHKLIRSFDDVAASKANEQSPVDVILQGDTIIIRCNQERVSSRSQVSTNLDISVPKDTSVQLTGTYGDFDVSSLTGSIDVSSENAGVRIQDIGGPVRIDTRHSDLIRCNNINGSVDLRGHGRDVEIAKVAGQVTIDGSYTGDVALRDLAKPVRVENMRTEFNVEQVKGEIRLERGNLTMQNVVGPTRLVTRATDVSLQDFTNGLELNVDKGDIELNPGHVPLGEMVVNTRSGNIELALPRSAAFAISAVTDKGDISNDFGEFLREHAEGRGAKLDGSVGSGPGLRLMTKRGRIIVRKAGDSAVPHTPEPPTPPTPPRVG